MNTNDSVGPSEMGGLLLKMMIEVMIMDIMIVKIGISIINDYNSNKNSNKSSISYNNDSNNDITIGNDDNNDNQPKAA